MKKVLTLLFSLAFSHSMFSQIPNYVSPFNLIGWWPFSSSLSDSSGNGNASSGSLYTLTSDRNGNSNKAVSFGATSSYVQFSNIPINLAGDYSINYWMKLNNYVAFNVILDMHPTNVCGSFPQIWEQYDSLYIVKCNNVPTKVSIGHKSVFLNNWKMVTHVIRNDSTFIYIDGTLLKKFPYTWGSSTNANIIVGNGYNASSAYLSGASVVMDDIGVWSRVLTECEISNLYNASLFSFTLQPLSQSVLSGTNVSFTINTNTPVVSYQWQLDNGTGFVNLTNAGQYSGVFTNTLNISNVNFSNNNTYYRCIVNSTSGCAATSNNATLNLYPEAINDLIYSGEYLFQNSPNPFKGYTAINYVIPTFKERACISVFDIQGKRMITKDIRKSGIGSMIIDGNLLNSGLYFYTLSIDGSCVDTKKLVVNK